MKKLEIYNAEKTYMYPNGEIAYPQRIQTDFPAVSVFTHVIETDESGQVCFAVQNLAALKSTYGIDAAMTDAEAISAIETILNTHTEPEPTAEERIAAAMEFQNMVTLASVAE